MTEVPMAALPPQLRAILRSLGSDSNVDVRVHQFAPEQSFGLVVIDDLFEWYLCNRHSAGYVSHR